MAERFEIFQLPDADPPAYLRVDLQTGNVSRCAEQDGTWRCTKVEDSTQELETTTQAKIRRLENRIAVLEARAHTPPGVEEMEQALDMSEMVMRRFFGMVQDIKKDMSQDK
ncbi:MAG: hypothetical protein COA52_19750 [Hyphomicrobiales bacterium]|nr:MAG: hypothetical protein COA52_19750 [Hyphomicrobiales bacterium]